MITVENISMFRGKIRITPKIQTVGPFEISGDIMCKDGYYYAKGSSYGAGIVEILEDETK